MKPSQTLNILAVIALAFVFGLEGYLAISTMHQTEIGMPIGSLGGGSH